MHVATALDQLGGVRGTASFPTTAAGYRCVLAGLQSHGDLVAVGVEGRGSYGAALARQLIQRDVRVSEVRDVRVVEVSRPNRQVRRRHGESDVV